MSQPHTHTHTPLSCRFRHCIVANTKCASIRNRSISFCVAKQITSGVIYWIQMMCARSLSRLLLPYSSASAGKWPIKSRTKLSVKSKLYAHNKAQHPSDLYQHCTITKKNRMQTERNKTGWKSEGLVKSFSQATKLPFYCLSLLNSETSENFIFGWEWQRKCVLCVVHMHM